MTDSLARDQDYVVEYSFEVSSLHVPKGEQQSNRPKDHSPRFPAP